eukprot:360157-Chlamydomonas_euryale.AAC.3
MDACMHDVYLHGVALHERHARRICRNAMHACMNLHGRNSCGAPPRCLGTASVCPSAEAAALDIDLLLPPPAVLLAKHVMVSVRCGAVRAARAAMRRARSAAANTATAAACTPIARAEDGALVFVPVPVAKVDVNVVVVVVEVDALVRQAQLRQHGALLPLLCAFGARHALSERLLRQPGVVLHGLLERRHHVARRAAQRLPKVVPTLERRRQAGRRTLRPMACPKDCRAEPRWLAARREPNYAARNAAGAASLSPSLCRGQALAAPAACPTVESTCPRTLECDGPYYTLAKGSRLFGHTPLGVI